MNYCPNCGCHLASYRQFSQYGFQNPQGGQQQPVPCPQVGVPNQPASSITQEAFTNQQQQRMRSGPHTGSVPT